jgi:hypothetical protein
LGAVALGAKRQGRRNVIKLYRRASKKEGAVMANDTSSAPWPELAGRPLSEFPDQRFPTAFADGVSSIATGAGNMKFCLYRVDPNLFGRGGAVLNPFLQVVMPTFGFVQTAVFFSRQLKVLVDQKVVTQEQIDQMERDLETAATAAAVETKK